MRIFLKRAALVTACITAFPANATNGYFLPGFGTRSQGMGGVGIAYGRDSLSTAANHASIYRIGRVSRGRQRVTSIRYTHTTHTL